MLQQFLGILAILIGIILVISGMQPYGYVSREKVNKIFSRVKWEKQVFRVDGFIVTDHKGNNSFYPSKDVDLCIEDLNKILEVK